MEQSEPNGNVFDTYTTVAYTHSSLWKFSFKDGGFI